MKSGKNENDEKENGIGLPRRYLLLRLGVLNWISSRYLFNELSKNMMRWPYPLGGVSKKSLKNGNTLVRTGSLVWFL